MKKNILNIYFSYIVYIVKFIKIDYEHRNKQ